MPTLNSSSRLKSDLLSDGLQKCRREPAVQIMVAAARTRRRKAAAIKGLTFAAILGWVAFHFTTPREQVQVQTQPTAPVIAAQQDSTPSYTLLKTGDLPPVPVVTTTRGGVTITSTDTSSTDLQLLSESELMRLLKGHSVALVKHSDGSAELILFTAPAE